MFQRSLFLFLPILLAFGKGPFLTALVPTLLATGGAARAGGLGTVSEGGRRFESLVPAHRVGCQAFEAEEGTRPSPLDTGGLHLQADRAFRGTLRA